ncbi:MAG: hypothetical protein KAT04_14445 [Methylococcales bacterium]|nr:hypothetical protein [Methylococcales bacterium]
MHKLSDRVSKTLENDILLYEALKSIERWEDYRLEMENFEHRMAETAKSFLELGAYSSAAECAIKADGMKFILGRMPSLK